MIAKPAVLTAMLVGLAMPAGLAIAPPPALAQTPVYVPSMGSAPTTRMPSTSSSGLKVYVPETGANARRQRPTPRIQAAPPQRYDNRSATVPMPSAPYGGRIEVPGQVRPNETFQDRAIRCNQYGGLYGSKNRAAFGNACINGN
ncbi:hypothetical protein [Blastochloris tepida]|uniref:Uncharacterized protein n=1 Tax=Blastochloris tepida TaxID=2233851 RepID=A0A348FVY5_9HYPH|nr:hypothetical protein [Blastochloris tepida]BBF91468.1 hypothetical protein BLTE_01530 [Blastochloris tepida]